MADYISRETAINFAEHAYHNWNLAMAAADGNRQINRCFKMRELSKAVASIFEVVPAADVEPVLHGRWIPVRERLPEKGERVMFWADRAGCILTGRFEYKGTTGVVWFDVGYDYSFSGTHWMRLPEPPKKGGTRSEEK